MTRPDQPMAVQVDAEIKQIRTMSDYSVTVSLSLPEYCTEQVKVLLDWLHAPVKVLIQVVGDTEER